MAESVQNLNKPSIINIVKVKKYLNGMLRSGKFLIAGLVFLMTIASTIDSSAQNSISSTQSNISLDDPEVLRIAVYPNPSNGDVFRINIIEHYSEVAEVKLYSALGDVILSETYTLRGQNQTLTLNPPSQLKAGVYMISVKTSGAHVTRRIIVRN